MTRVRGQWVRMSLPRRLIVELLDACRGIPIITIERRMHLSEVVAARAALENPPSWVVLFARAFGLVAVRRPELRRAYLPAPWPHMYETSESVASIAVERLYEGEPAVFFGQLRGPENQTLVQLHEALRGFRAKPLDDVREFRRTLKIMQLPRLLRRPLWWYAINLRGTVRTRHFGTFGISSTASAGSTCRNLISPVTAAINYGVLNDDGTLDVRMHFDHRVLDGMPAARALADIEEVLNTTLLAELRGLITGPARLPAVKSVDVLVR
jgi:hypothetical protein